MRTIYYTSLFTLLFNVAGILPIYGIIVREAKGTYPSVSMNKTGKIVYANRSGSKVYYDLHYSMLDFNNGAPSIIRNYLRYDNGKGINPSISINNNNIVVEVHEGSTRGGNCYYKIGNFNEDAKVIDWTGGGRYETKGVLPSVAINTKGQVVEMHSDRDFKKLYYRVGEINYDENGIIWEKTQQLFGWNQNVLRKNWVPDWPAKKNFKGFTVSINENNEVAEVHVEKENKLYTRIGILDPKTKLIDWGKVQYYDTGYTPSICINDFGDVLEAHMGDTNGIWSRWGRFDRKSKTIEWLVNENVYEESLMPAVAMNNAGDMYIVRSKEDNR